MTSPFLRYLARRERRRPDAAVTGYRRRLLAGLTGPVIEVGCGEGRNFAHYPDGVSVLAVEPDPAARAVAKRAAPPSIEVVAGTAEALPAAAGVFDAAVCCWALCSVVDPAAALAELRRVLRPGGELRFFEHVRTASRAGALAQRALDATLWPPLVGGCHTARDTETAIRVAGFEIERLERVRHASSWLTAPTAPHILGSARAPH